MDSLSPDGHYFGVKVVLPIKQGLKLNYSDMFRCVRGVKVVLPIKQGLKLKHLPTGVEEWTC